MHLQITCYRAVPLRIFSRMWGWITNRQLPLSVRPWLYNYYASTFGCNLQEAAHEDLTAYRSLAEFFCRPLKDGVRPIDEVDCIVSNLFVSPLGHVGGRGNQVQHRSVSLALIIVQDRTVEYNNVGRRPASQGVKYWIPLLELQTGQVCYGIFCMLSLSLTSDKVKTS